MLRNVIKYVDMNKSVSDNLTYPEICNLAASDDSYFKTFKHQSGYTEILEHVTCEQGVEYARLFQNNKNILSNLSKFTVNDTLGSPRVCTYEFGTFSPTTLRYMKVLNDLSQLNLNDKTIVEIGAGYGGQYTVLRQLYKPKKYIFVDLASTLLLIEKYISKLGLSDIEVEFMEGNNTKPVVSDLVISNYAFSECPTSIQDDYIANILEHAKNGYMIYNNMLGYTHEQLISKCSKAIKVNQEIPLTSSRNVLISW
jgi:putative sugar O-methyltransferase